MNYENKVTPLAQEFSAVLKSWLTPYKIKQINKRNKTEAYRVYNSCASHDYCDANMAMDAAFQKVMQREFVFFDEDIPATYEQHSSDTDLTNAAWTLAKENDFYYIG